MSTTLRDNERYSTCNLESSIILCSAFLRHAYRGWNGFLPCLEKERILVCPPLFAASYACNVTRQGLLVTDILSLRYDTRTYYCRIVKNNDTGTSVGTTMLLKNKSSHSTHTTYRTYWYFQRNRKKNPNPV
jgi:hypothetical protein